MPRVKWQVASRRRRKRLIKKAKGYWGARGSSIRRVKETVMRAMAYSTRDRKVKKREFRSLWIIRLNASARERGMTYSQLISAFRKAQIGLNRKQLSELAINDPQSFEQVVSAALEAAKSAPAAAKKPAAKPRAAVSTAA